MIWIVLISLAVFIVSFFIVIADMMRKSAGWGCLGLLFFPATLIWAVTTYSGRKKLVATLLYCSITVLGLSTYLEIRSAKATLKKFFVKIQQEVEPSCRFSNAISWASDFKVYFVWCRSAAVESIKYKDVDEMVERYEQNIIEPLLEPYAATLGSNEEVGIDIAIMSPSSIVACFEVRAPGTVTRSWHSGTEEPCGR